MKEYILNHTERLSTIPVAIVDNSYQFNELGDRRIKLLLQYEGLEQRDETIKSVIHKINHLKNNLGIESFVRAENEEALFIAIIELFLPNINKYINQANCYSKTYFSGGGNETKVVFRLPHLYEMQIDPFFTEFNIIVE